MTQTPMYDQTVASIGFDPAKMQVLSYDFKDLSERTPWPKPQKGQGRRIKPSVPQQRSKRR